MFRRKSYLFKSQSYHVIYYKWQFDSLLIPEVTEEIRIDKELQVKLFDNEAAIPLPTWFRHGGNFKLDRKSMLSTLPNYSNSQSLTYFKIFLEPNSR